MRKNKGKTGDLDGFPTANRSLLKHKATQPTSDWLAAIRCNTSLEKMKEHLLHRQDGAFRYDESDLKIFNRPNCIYMFVRFANMLGHPYSQDVSLTK
jgi:hypothetical protein